MVETYWGSLAKSADDSETIEEAIERIAAAHNYFLPVAVWAMLAKSQVDNETIEQAIARLILDHCADETAHLGVGQSLQSHKASEIIDHLAESVVSDKILNWNIMPQHMSNDKVQIWPSFESLDCWETSGAGGYDLYLGGIYLYCNGGAGTYKQIYGAADIFDLDLGVKNPVFECVVECISSIQATYYFGLGSNQTDGFGFRVLNGVLYTFVSIDEVIHFTEIPGMTPTDWHSYRAVSTSGSNVEFFVDDVLVHTETTYLPRSCESLSSIFFYVGTSGASAKSLHISDARFYKDK